MFADNQIKTRSRRPRNLQRDLHEELLLSQQHRLAARRLNLKSWLNIAAKIQKYVHLQIKTHRNTLLVDIISLNSPKLLVLTPT